jgi:hypothetical protein
MEIQGESTDLVHLLRGLYIDPQYPAASFTLKIVIVLYKTMLEQIEHTIWLNRENNGYKLNNIWYSNWKLTHP